MSERQPQSIAEFTDRMTQHHDTHDDRVYAALPEPLADKVVGAGHALRAEMGLSWAGLGVFFGEQTYGPGPQKVLGKRLLGRAAQLYAGATTIELMASQDAVGSESDLRTFILPNSQSREGISRINLLPGWKKIGFQATINVPSPTADQIKIMNNSVTGLYDKGKPVDFLHRLEAAYLANPDSYGQANTTILRDYESALGIAGDQLYHDGYIDSLIAQRGGLEAMLQLWPNFVEAAQNHAVEGVRIPDAQEAPFYLYHDECGGRMNVSLPAHHDAAAAMDTPLDVACMHCDHTESVTPGDVIEAKRTLTFRAMSRVAAYSLFRLADGQITGGGSIYNAPTAGAMEQLGLPYWPLMHMSKTTGTAHEHRLFNYWSAATTKKKARTLPNFDVMAKILFAGKVSMADLEISTNAEDVRQAIEDALQKPGAFTPYSRIDVPPAEATNHG